MKKRYIVRTVLIVLGVLILAVGSFALEQYYRLQVSNFRSKDGLEHSYHIYPGATIDSVFALLDSDYFVGSRHDFYLHKRLLVFNYPEPGHYTFPPQIGDKQLIDRLKYGRQTPVRITWNNNVRTKEDLAGKVTAHLMIDSATVYHLLDSNAYLAPMGFNRETSRCLFIPNTYEVLWNITPDKLFGRMQYEYNQFWNETRRHKADSIGLTPIEVSIIASIVESETHNRKEQPIIASLYINRVRKGMNLQACPTVKYALGDFKLRRILNRHLAVDNPYNTYKYPGLPPGPIRCADPVTMDIVLNAPKTDVLFMCASPDLSGTHIFSSTYGGHAAAAAQYRYTMDTINWERYDAMRKAEREAKKQEATNN